MRSWVTKNRQGLSSLNITYNCCENGKAFTVSTGVVRGGVAHVTIGAHDCKSGHVFMASAFQPGLDGAWLGDVELLDDLLSDLGDLPEDAKRLAQNVRSKIRMGYLQEMGVDSEGATGMSLEPREHTPDMTQRPDYNSSVEEVRRGPEYRGVWDQG